MFKITDLIDLQTLSESVELEFKQAQGQDGQGKLPQDFWPTYSAMANTRGGYVILGVKEKQGQFIPVGINDPEKIKKELFNNLNNNNLVSVNLITDAHVQTTLLNDKLILIIHIPIATRHQKPVYLKKNPLEHTYIRLHEGDRHCSQEQVKRMLAE